MIRAFVAGIAISVIAPLIGSFLVVKRLSLISDTLSHIALAGVAVGLLIGVQPLITTLLITIIASIAIEFLRSNKHIPGEAILAMFLPGGLALSIILIALAHGFNANLFSYLFGSISTVTNSDLLLILGLAIVTMIIVRIFYARLFYVAIDEEGARVSGVKTRFINILLVVLTAVAVSLAMRVVGVLLIGALMVIPVVTGMQIARSFKQMIFLGVIFAFVAVCGGLIAAYYLNLPSGGTIVLLSLGIFLLVSFLLEGD
jgi:zinc transport system permease protein